MSLRMFLLGLHVYLFFPKGLEVRKQLVNVCEYDVGLGYAGGVVDGRTAFFNH